MKRIIILTCYILLRYINTTAQSYLPDAVNMSNDFYRGTARSLAMGNAFTSLGGDLGSISINPAGIGVYQRGEMSFTAGLLSFDNKANYYNTNNTDNGIKFDLSSIGLVLNLKKTPEEEWKDLNFYFGYSKLNNLNGSFRIKGETNNTTFANELISYANGLSYNQLDNYFERIAFEAFIIDTITGNPTLYYSPYSGIPLLQQRNVETIGSIGEYSFGLGANYNHKFYLGITISVRSGYYEEIYNHTERDIDNRITDNYYTFNYKLTTSLSGWNAKVGVIYRPIENIRLGLNIHTPSIIRVEQAMNTNIRVLTDNGEIYNIYPEDSYGNRAGSLTDNYTLTTPFRTNAGISYLFGEYGLLSVDYERADYVSIKVSNADYEPAKDNTNDDVRQWLRVIHNFRIGGEMRIERWYLRGGFAYYQSPYIKSELNGDAHRYMYSGGIGYRGKNFMIDFAYMLSKYSKKYYLYNDPFNYVEPAKLDDKTGNYCITLGFRF